jgi:hypothetical protein
MRRFAMVTNALIWALMGFGAGTFLMIWIFNAS